MSFGSVALRTEYGVVHRIDVSADNFSTIAYRWADRAIDDGTNVWEARVNSLGDIQRALGEDRVATSASTSVELDNIDGALDGLMTGSAFGTLRFRIYAVIYTEVAPPAVPTLETKLLGEFTMSSPAHENNSRITLSLGDDMMTRIGAGLMLPTFRDWYAVGNSSNNPLRDSGGSSIDVIVGLPDSLSYDTPIQLAFGEDWLQALPHVLCPFNTNYNSEIIVPLYSTVDLSAVSQSLVSRLRVERANLSTKTELYDVPQVFPDDQDMQSVAGSPVWLVEKSPTITKNGKNFQIVYLRVKTSIGVSNPAITANPDGGSNVDVSNEYERQSPFQMQGGYPARIVVLMDGVAPTGSPFAYYAHYGSRVVRWFVMAGPKSQITNPPEAGAPSHAVDIATDLVTQYLAGAVDTTRAARVKSGNPNAAATGVVHPWTERQNYTPVPGQPNTLRQDMSRLAQSSDIDFFINWSGELAFASDVWAWLAEGGPAAIAALAAYDETDISDLERWLPAEGERWAPFNRIYLEGGKEYPPENLGISFQGAFDVASTQLDDLIPQTSRIVEITLQQGWRPYRQQKDTPLNFRQVDGSSRWRIRFNVHLLFLQHDLGDYFRLTWRRDSTGAALYDGTVFQVEALSYSAARNSVTVEAIWRDDARTTRQYLLDDDRYFDFDFGTTFEIETESGVALETEAGEALELEVPFAAYVYSSGGRTWVTTPESEVFSLLAVGDLFLTVWDPLYPSPVWNIGAWRIDQIDTSGAAPGGHSAIRLVAHPDGTLPATSLPQLIPGNDWTIQHSPLTLSNLANHPNGVRVYGCATNSSGQLSDNSLGNKLLNG